MLELVLAIKENHVAGPQLRFSDDTERESEIRVAQTLEQ